jgi:hypothetical protein
MSSLGSQRHATPSASDSQAIATGNVEDLGDDTETEEPQRPVDKRKVIANMKFVLFHET